MGRKALIETDAIRTARSFCEECPSGRGFDDVMMRACAMVHSCYERDTLPLERLECPIKFDIPQQDSGELLIVDSGSSSDEDEPEEAAEEDNEDDSDSDDGSDSASEAGSQSDDEELDDDDIKEELVDELVYRYNKITVKESVNNNERNNNNNQSPWKGQGGNFDVDLDNMARVSRFFAEFTEQYNQDNLMNLGSFEIFEGIQVENINDLANEYSIPITPHNYAWAARHDDSLRPLYFHLANKVKHISPFVKIAYPDICLGISGQQVENLGSNMDRTLVRNYILSDMGNVINKQISFRPRVVYSLDDLLTNSESEISSHRVLENNDENVAGRYDAQRPLSFESRFESGNLRKAIQVGDYEYDLLLTSDINSCRHNQWFYFQVGNMSDEFPYTFNVVNCLKTNSLFNYGMQPMIFSVMDALDGRPGWVRSGNRICYFRNGYKCIGKKSNTKTYFTLSFTLNFRNRGDIVYIAYYIPYTYTRLLVELHSLFRVENRSDKVHSRCEVLCKSLDGNDIPLVTITAPVGGENSSIKSRDVIFITARVHPGETNASWIMMGTLRKLMSGSLPESLLQRYVFKIVPMLNVEGVVNGW